jgi:ligand-binding sensor domain-containing protein
MKTFILFVSLFSGLMNAQNWQRFVNWNEGDCMLPQNDSLLWVGTKVGLIKWDLHNNTFQTFEQKDGLLSTAINDLTIDNSGNLWMATDNGIVKYDGFNFILFNYKNNSNLPKAHFLTIIADSNNNIIAGTGSYIRGSRYNYSSIVRYHNGQWIVYNGNDYNFSWYATDMAIYQGKVFIVLPFQISIWTTRFYTFENNELKQIPNLEVPMYANNLTIDYEDSLWLGCSRFLYKYINNRWVTVINGDSAHVGSLWKFAWSDDNNGLWLGGSKFGFYHLNIDDNRRGIHYSNNLPAGMEEINQFNIAFKDYAHVSNNYYFVSRKGLAKLNGNQVRYSEIPHLIEQNNIFGLGTSPFGEILVSGSISTQKFDGTNWETVENTYYDNDFCYSPNGTLYTNNDPYFGHSSGLDFDEEGNLWIAPKVTEYKWPNLYPNHFSTENMGIEVANGQSPPQFKDVFIDNSDHVWFDGSGYIVMFDGTRWHIFDANDVGVYWLELDYAFADSKGRKWFTDNSTTPNWGLLMYDNENWHVLNFPELYRGQYIYQISEDNFGNLWFASQAGLIKYDNTYWYIFNNDAFPNIDFTSTTAVTADYRGNIWVGTKKGLYVYNPFEVDLDSDINISPVDSFKVFKSNEKIIANIDINHSLQNLKTIELQRGVKSYKFWTVSKLEPQNSYKVTLIDSSLIIGPKLYRIKAVDIFGKAYYSITKSIIGDSVGVSLNNFRAEVEGNHFFFKWETSEEKNVTYYEIHSMDT